MSILADVSESWSERMKLRLFFGVLVFLVVSTVASCNESRYLIWGKTASAKVDRVESVTIRGRYGSETQKIRVSYSFPDGDLGTRKEEDDVSLDFLDPQATVNAGTVEVQYLPGTADRSRLAGHTYVWLTIPFVICLAITTVFSIRFWRDFQDHERRSKATSELYKR